MPFRPIVAIILLLAACTASPTTVSNGPGESMVAIPMQTASGATVDIQARFCRPEANAPVRLVIINHGTPPNAGARVSVRPASCSSEAVAWFLGRGYAVLQPIRRGFGATGGAYVEGYDRCDNANYVRQGLEAARDVAAAIDWGTAQPGIRPDGVIVVGQSTGGWTTIALDSQPHPKVVAFINMAGGHGGHMNDTPNRNCHPEWLVQAAGVYGSTASTPMLWVYTANDSFFARPMAEAMYAAFTKAGGHATFEEPGPFGNDGHTLFFGRGGSNVWGPMADRYLAQQLDAQK
jgi:dienelactone hydrolase